MLSHAHLLNSDSAVAIANTVRSGRSWIRTLSRVKISSSLQTSRRPTGTGVLSPGAKRTDGDTDLSSPSNTAVKNQWIYTSALTIYLHGVDRDSSYTFCLHTFVTAGVTNITMVGWLRERARSVTFCGRFITCLCSPF